jgi:hypothetical protein
LKYGSSTPANTSTEKKNRNTPTPDMARRIVFFCLLSNLTKGSPQPFNYRHTFNKVSAEASLFEEQFYFA